MVKKSKDMANLFLAAKILGKGGGSPTPPEPPADGKTRLYITVVEGRLSPVLGLGVNGSVDVDWGDGTAHGTLTGSNTATLVTISHTYVQGGDYVITLTAAEGTEIVVLGGRMSLLLTKDGTANDESRVYLSALKEVHLGDIAIGDRAFSACASLTNISIPGSVTNIRANAFNSCFSLTNISIPGSVTNIGLGVFQSCVSLASITIPDSVTNIVSYAFNNCHSLTSIFIPDSVTSIEDSVFVNCYNLSSIRIPNGVTSIGSSTFSNCYGLGFIKFISKTPPTVTNVNAWNDIPTDCIIYVPHGTLSSYTSAANYPDPETYTYVEY